MRVHGDSSAPASEPAGSATDLHLLDASMHWGAARGVQRLLASRRERVLQQGWRHTTLAPGAHGAGQLDCGGLPLPGAGGGRLLLRRGRAERLIEQARPDIVEVADPCALAWAVLSATRRLGVPAVAACHGNLPALAARVAGARHGDWAASKARDYLLRLYEHFDLVLSPCLGLTAALQGWGIRQAVHQPLGVDCQVFHPGAAEPAWRHGLCLRLGLNPRTKLIVCTGRFGPDQKLPLLARAVARLGEGHALIAVGSGPCEPRGRNVFVLPMEKDGRRLATLLASCDAYVHAGEQETFGLGVLEAMACGTPVVATSRGCVGEWVKGVGTRVETASSPAWAEALAACLDPQDWQARRLAALALERAGAHDWSVVLPQQLARYQRVIRRHAVEPVMNTARGLMGAAQ